jgi:hypothetical protein
MWRSINGDGTYGLVAKSYTDSLYWANNGYYGFPLQPWLNPTDRSYGNYYFNAGVSAISGIDNNAGSWIDLIIPQVTYYNPGQYNLLLKRTGVKGVDWYYPHSKTTQMQLNLLSNIPSANFIAYPSYVWDTSATLTPLNGGNVYSTSQGVCAYDVLNNEVFNLSAQDQSYNYNYNWFIDGFPLNQNSAMATYTAVGLLTGSQIKLGLYNDQLPITMPSYYNSDLNGQRTKYDNVNFTTSANDNKLFQHIRTFNYDINYPTLTSNTTDVLVIPINSNMTNTVTGLMGLNINTNSPFCSTPINTHWLLSANTWLINGSSLLQNSVSANFNLNYDATDQQYYYPGYILHDSIGTLMLQTYSDASVTWPGQSQSATVYSIPDVRIINVTGGPLPKLQTDSKFILTGANISFENVTNQLLSSLISAFIFDDGSQNIQIKNTNIFDNFNATYNMFGTYSPGLSVVLNSGIIYGNIFNDMITVGVPYFDPTIGRSINGQNLQLPYNYQDVIIGTNEWVDHNIINNVFNKLDQNNKYIEENFEFYELPPVGLLGWFGSANINGVVVNGWKTKTKNNFVSTKYAIDGMLKNLQDIFIKGDITYVIDENKIKIFKGDKEVMVDGVKAETNSSSIGDIFGKLVSIYVDNNNKIYVLDQLKNMVYVFRNFFELNKFDLYYQWGGLGGLNAHNKYQSPNQMFIENDNYLWIVDTGNSALKKYSKSGNLIKIFDLSQYCINSNQILSMAIDSYNNYHILMNKMVLLFDSSMNYKGSYKFDNPNSAKVNKIIAAVGGGFLYICLQDRIIKVRYDGSLNGVFAYTIEGNVKFNSLYQDNNFNLYVANTNYIIQYIDYPKINTLRNITTNLQWPLSSIYIKANEFAQDWVYNRSFAYIWDNIELLRRSLIGSPFYSRDSYGIPTVSILDFDIDKYKNSIVNTKDQIFIGVNELFTREVFNRCIQKLINNQIAILKLIKEEDTTNMMVVSSYIPLESQCFLRDIQTIAVPKVSSNFNYILPPIFTPITGVSIDSLSMQNINIDNSLHMFDGEYITLNANNSSVYIPLFH